MSTGTNVPSTMTPEPVADLPPGTEAIETTTCPQRGVFMYLGGGERPADVNDPDIEAGRRIGIVVDDYPYFLHRRAYEYGEERLETDPDKGFWLGWMRSDTSRVSPSIIRWPNEPVVDLLVGVHAQFSRKVHEEVSANIAANHELMRTYEGRVGIPAASRFAVIGRGGSADKWADGDSLGVKGHVAWEPEVTIYLNWDKRPVRRLRDGATRWLAVMDRRVPVTALDIEGEVNHVDPDGTWVVRADGSAKWDGVILSLGASQEILKEAVARGLPIIVCDPSDGAPGTLYPGWFRVGHQLSVSGMVMNLLGIGSAGGEGLRRPQSLFLTGLDGNATFPTTPRPANGTLEFDAWYQPHDYWDIGVMNAGMAFYLSCLGIEVIQMYGSNTPYALGHRALQKWTHKQTVLRERAEADEENAKPAGIIKPPKGIWTKGKR